MRKVNALLINKENEYGIGVGMPMSGPIFTSNQATNAVANQKGSELARKTP